MPSEIARDERTWSLMLSGVIGVREAADLHAAALDVARAAVDVVVRLEAVETVDTAATQLLLALKRAVIGAGRRFGLASVPPDVAACWSASGLAGELLSPTDGASDGG